MLLERSLLDSQKYFFDCTSKDPSSLSSPLNNEALKKGKIDVRRQEEEDAKRVVAPLLQNDAGQIIESKDGVVLNPTNLSLSFQ